MKQYTLLIRRKDHRDKRIKIKANSVSEAIDEVNPPEDVEDIDVLEVETVGEGSGDDKDGKDSSSDGEHSGKGGDGEGSAGDSETDGEDGDVEILSVEEVTDDGESKGDGDGSSADKDEDSDDADDTEPRDEHWYWRGGKRRVA